MSPTDLEDILRQQPSVPLRITVASGDQFIVNRPTNTLIAQGTLVFTVVDEYSGPYGNIKHISIPNITIVERLDPRRPHNGHSRRRRRK